MKFWRKSEPAAKLEPPKDVETTSSAHQERFRALDARCEQLEADLDWLRGEVKRIRGKITGGEKGKNAPESPENDEQAPPAQQGGFHALRKRYGIPGGR